jgi:eukaryotic-like serine/threonine-protein kinase
MTLAAGVRLGPYEIVAPLGAGGMGEVYRARDTRLSRDVALKVLLPEVAADASRLKRFEKEARAASALNHPNIVTIYDIGSSDSTAYIAMERIEGTTLRELVMGSPLPIRKLLQIAPQIAEGLAKAHEAGIVHRDLKPDNVMVNKEGTVKILDFGLAKLASTGSTGEEGSLSTIGGGGGGTQPGLVMGTVGYMSPEQASAGALDYRSDQFSLGSILYEMATGKRAFSRKTGADTLAAIINDEPESIGQLNPRIPAPLRWITERCLAKEPERRYRSTEDLARDLATVRDRLSEASSSGEGLSIAPVSPRRWFGYLAAVAVLLAAIGGVFALGKRAGETPLPSFHQLTFRRGTVLTARFTSDGRTVVYSAAFDGNSLRVFSTRVENPESGSIPLPDSELAAVSSRAELLVQPDRTLVPYGRWPTNLARVPLAGGTPRVIAANVQSADWGPDGDSVALIRQVGDHRQLEYPAGKVLVQSQSLPFSPRVSRDGALVAYYTDSSAGNSVAVVDRLGKTKILSSGWKWVGAYLAWSPKGDEVWFTATKGGWSAPLRAVSLSGRERVLLQLPGWVNLQDVSSDGHVLLTFGKNRQTIRCRLPGWERERDLSWFESSTVWDLSADGKTIVFTERGETAPVTTIYLRKTDGSPPQRLGEGNPSHISPDGEAVLATDEKGWFGVPTGPGMPVRAPIQGPGEILNLNWFPDNKHGLAVIRESDHKVRTEILNLEDGSRQPWSPEGFDCYLLSPDGNRALCHTPQGERIYSFDRKETREIPSLPNEDIIQWGADSNSLYVVADGNEAGSKISRLDLSTGKRQPWRELGPLDQTALVQQPLAIKITPDGGSYCYNTWQLFHDLYLVEGLR